MALIEKLNAIGDAIRSKTGKEDKLTLEQMVTEIEGIEVGGSDELALSIIERTATSISSNKVTQVGTHALSYYTSLKSVDLPECTIVKSNGFAESKALATVNLPKATTIETSSFRHCYKLANVNIPNITSLGSSAFESCKINKIDIGKVPQIAANTFNACANLETIILRLTSKICTLANVNAFNATPIKDGTGFIYVPQALIEQYKSATNWINFSEQFRAIEDYPEICGGQSNG